MTRLSTKMIPERILDIVKHSRPVYTAARKVRFAIGSTLGARPVPGVSGRIHYNDFMLSATDPANVESYRDGAMQFVNILDRSLAEAGRNWSDVESALEIGCGYGRIVRELRARLPADRIHVTDLIDEGVRFTAEEFGVRRIPVVEEAGPEWNGRFDLIYLLSVYTHLRRDLVMANLRSAQDLLKPGGIVVFTIHGEGSAQQAEIYKQYWLDKAELLRALLSQGYYYARYPYYYFEYGLAWFTRPAVEAVVAQAAPGLQAISFHPLGIDDHQDVFVYQKQAA